jgi:ubiquinone/menaquinone biosynthesis C-methylase UbiE
MHERRYAADIERLRSPHRVEMLEVDRVVRFVLAGIDVRSVLDAGTGSGIFAEAFEKQGISVTGLDPHPGMLKIAKEFVRTGNFLEGIIEEIPLPNKASDLVFLGHVLHESDDIVKALAESKRCAKYRVAVLEWPYKQEEDGPPLEHRLKTEDILAAATTIGFSQMETIQLHHMVLFLFTI